MTVILDEGELELGAGQFQNDGIETEQFDDENVFLDPTYLGMIITTALAFVLVWVCLIYVGNYFNSSTPRTSGSEQNQSEENCLSRSSEKYDSFRMGERKFDMEFLLSADFNKMLEDEDTREEILQKLDELHQLIASKMAKKQNLPKDIEG